MENDSRGRGRGELGCSFRMRMFTQKLTFQKKSGGCQGVTTEVIRGNDIETQKEPDELYLDKPVTDPEGLQTWPGSRLWLRVSWEQGAVGALRADVVRVSVPLVFAVGKNTPNTQLVTGSSFTC